MVLQMVRRSPSRTACYYSLASYSSLAHDPLIRNFAFPLLSSKVRSQYMRLYVTNDAGLEPAGVLF